eukprot:652062_1
MGIKDIIINTTKPDWIQYQVKRCDTGEIIELYDDVNDFQILGPYDKTTELQKKNDQLRSQNKQLTSDMNRLREEIDTYKATVNSLRSNNSELQSRIRRSNNDNDELKMECHNAITRKDEFQKKYTSFTHQFDRLQQESDQLKRQYTEQRQLVAQLREDKIDDSYALDLSRGFPPVQDIVNDFGTLKSHYHVEARKQLKKVLKQRNKEHSKVRKFKFVCEILFDILMKSYGAIKTFKDVQFRNIAMSNELDIHNARHKKRLERMVKEAYSVLIGTAKKEKAQAILDEIKAQYGMNDCLTDDTELREYTEECIAICWMIVLVRDPMLSIEPQQFDQSDKEICFDE